MTDLTTNLLILTWVLVGLSAIMLIKHFWNNNMHCEDETKHWRITGNVLRRLRRDLNLTQKQLADKLGYRQQDVSYWETGVRPIPEDVKEFVRLML